MPSNSWIQGLYRRNSELFLPKIGEKSAHVQFILKNRPNLLTDDGMSTCPNDLTNKTIAEALVALGPRTVEGDQGRVSMASVHETIAAIEYDRQRNQLRNRSSMSNALRTISNHRLATHDGRAS